MELNLPERLRQLDRLTPSEAKIADFFQREYPRVAFETPTSISEKAGVSKATVVRFLARLGYQGFSDFQEQLRCELVRRLNRPIDRFAFKKSQSPGGEEDLLGQVIDSVMKDLRETHARNRTSTIWEAARMLASSRNSLYVIGQHSSFGLAHYFWCRAVYLRPRCHLIDNLGGTLPQQMMDVGKGDVMLVVIHRGYTSQTLTLARHFAQRGGRIVVLTDREDSPASPLADVLLVAPVGGMEMFESRVGSLVLLQTLLAAMASMLDRGVYRRWERAEAAFRDLGTFAARARPLFRSDGEPWDARRKKS